MITIRINNKKVLIPKFEDLTVKQYRDLLPHIATSGLLDVLRYISITTGIDYEESKNSEFKGLDVLNDLMGDFRFIAGANEQIKSINYIEGVKPKMLMKVRGKYIDLRKFKPKAIGYRILVEQFIKTEPSVLDLYVFMCAAVLHSNFDYDEIIEFKEYLEDHPAYEVLSIGAFFFIKLKKGENKGRRLLTWLRKVLLTNMLTTRPQLVLTNSINIKLPKK